MLWQERHVAAMAAVTTRLVVAGADEQPPQPGVEAVVVSQAREVAPGSDERLLHRVLRSRAVAQHERGSGVEPIDSR